MKKGLVIGKFYPPHNGHHYLIDVASEQSDLLDVLICDNPAYVIPAEVRKTWLINRHPTAKVHIIPDIEKDDDSRAWAQHTKQFLGYTPDVVFSSEDYGDAYAKHMNAVHVAVDKARRTVPVSGTNVRADVLKNWHFLQPQVRADYAIRICILGAESTGTTTLSKALAKHYAAPWVPEYGRYYTEALNDMTHEWHSEEFTFIARQQQAMEHALAGQSKGLLICDTNAFATRLWHKRYMGTYSAAVDAIATQDRVDLYIVTDDSIPFVQDGIRDGQHIRHDMHEQFVAAVQSTAVPSMICTGTVQERRAQAIKAIDAIITQPRLIT